MKKDLITKINEIEKSIESEQKYFVNIKTIKMKDGNRYEVFLSNSNFENHKSPLWMSVDFMIPYVSDNLSAVIAEASMWGRFFGVEVKFDNVE